MKSWILPTLLTSLIFICSTSTQVLAVDVGDWQKAVSDYTFRLDLYRQQYQDFVVKRSDFQANSSIANQEKLVLEAKVMLVNRAEVWWAYWQALRLELLIAEGLGSDEREQLTGQLGQAQAQLRQDISVLEGLTTRQALLNEAEIFQQRIKAMNGLSYQVLVRLELSRIRHAIAQLTNMYQQLSTLMPLQIKDSNTREVRQRGADEMLLVLTSAQDRLEDLELNSRITDRSDPERTFQRLREDLSTMYPDLLRLMNISVELSEGLLL